MQPVKNNNWMTVVSEEQDELNEKIVQTIV